MRNQCTHSDGERQDSSSAFGIFPIPTFTGLWRIREALEEGGRDAEEVGSERKKGATKRGGVHRKKSHSGGESWSRWSHKAALSGGERPGVESAYETSQLYSNGQ